MEEKDSEKSGPCEEFWICFCGEFLSGSVAWYCIDVSEKTESRTKKLNPFLVTEHFPSVYNAFLKGCIYSLGGQLSDRTLLNDVWILDIKSLDSFAARGEEKLKEPEKPQNRLKLKEPEFETPKEPEKPQKTLKLKKPLETPKKPKRIFSVGSQRSPISWRSHGILRRRRSFEPESLPMQPPSSIRMSYVDQQRRQRRLPWIRGTSMTFARCNPHTMVVEQKLYVLGGFESNQNQANGWIEVFDPEKEKWESLPSPPRDQIHSSVMISGFLRDKKEIIIADQSWDRDPMLFYRYNIMTRCWNTLLPQASVHLPPNAGRAVTVDNTLYWISTEEHNHECIIRAYDLDRNMWFEDLLNTATIFGRREHFSSIYSSRPGFLHLRDQKFCLLLQSSITKDDPESSIEYLYCVTLEISPIYEGEDRGKFELTTVSFQKYSMDDYIHFLDCMLVDRVSGVESVDRRGESTSTTSVSSRLRDLEL